MNQITVFKTIQIIAISFLEAHDALTFIFSHKRHTGDSIVRNPLDLTGKGMMRVTIEDTANVIGGQQVQQTIRTGPHRCRTLMCQ